MDLNIWILSLHLCRHSNKKNHLCESLKWSDEAAVWDLDVWEVTYSVVTIQSHLSFFSQPLISFILLLGEPILKDHR